MAANRSHLFFCDQKTHVTKVKVAGTLRVLLPETAAIIEIGYGAWNVPATFVTRVSIDVERRTDRAAFPGILPRSNAGILFSPRQ